MNNKFIQIDGQKLSSIILEKKKSFSEISVGIGMAKGYISESIRRGYISKQSMMLLTRIYGIEKSDIERLSESECAEVQHEEEKQDYAELYKCIYAAVYHAMVKALESDMENKE